MHVTHSHTNGVFLLSQYDNGLARLLFASLFNAIFGEIDHHLTEEEAETTKKAVRIGINTILESSQQYFPPFIGSLQVTVTLCTQYTTMKHLSN